jgi:hypothetical protein
MRRVAEGLGCKPKGPKEAPSHSLTISKSGLARDFFNWQSALLEHEPRRLQAQVLNCFRGWKTGL